MGAHVCVYMCIYMRWELHTTTQHTTARGEEERRDKYSLQKTNLQDQPPRVQRNRAVLTIITFPGCMTWGGYGPPLTLTTEGGYGPPPLLTLTTEGYGPTPLQCSPALFLIFILLLPILLFFLFLGRHISHLIVHHLDYLLQPMIQMSTHTSSPLPA